MSYLSLLRRPVPLLLWLGQIASLAGDRLYAMAVLWLTLSMTGSTTATATVALASAIPQALVGLLGAGIVDRLNRFRLMIRLDLIRALLLLVLPALYYVGHLQPWHMGALGIVMGSLDALFSPAFQATLPLAASAAEFPGLAGLMDTPARIARMLGPGLAGLLLTWMSPVHLFSIDAASFVLSALALSLAGRYLLLELPRQEGTSSRFKDLRAELREGFRQLAADRDVLLIVASDVIGNFAWAAFNLGGLLLATVALGSDVGGYGLLIGAYGVGSLGGNLVAGNLKHGLSPALLAKASWLGIGIGFVAMGLAPTLPWAIGASALAGAFGSLAHVCRAIYYRQAVPIQHLGKVYSLLHLGTLLTSALGSLICGVLLERVPATFVLAGAGLFMVVSATAILLVGRNGRAVQPVVES